MKRLAYLLLLVPLAFGGCDDQGNQKLTEAQDLMGKGELPQAEKIISEVLKKYPENAKAYNNLGFLYAAQKKADQARESYRKAEELYLKNDPGNTEELSNVYNNLALLDDMLGNTEQALASYQKAISVDSQQMRPLHNLGTLYRKLRQYDKAIESFDKALKIDPYSYETRIYRAQTLLDAGKPEDAVKAYSSLLAEDPFKVYLQTQLAWSYVKAKDLDKALFVLGSCQAMNPGSAETESYIALVLLLKGKTEKGVESAKNLENLLAKPDSDKEHLNLSLPLARNLGLLHKQLGDAASAKLWLDKAIALDASDLDTQQALEELKNGIVGPTPAPAPPAEAPPAEGTPAPAAETTPAPAAEATPAPAATP